MTCVKDILSKKHLFRMYAKRTFDAVDFDGSGQISQDELYTILCAICEDVGFEKPTEQENKQILSKIDKDNSGSINFEEFKRLFKKLLQIIDEN